MTHYYYIVELQRVQFKERNMSPYGNTKRMWTYDEYVKEYEKLLRTMKLHAGDCCSLNNEVELFRGHWDDAEDEVKKLRKALETIINEKGDYWYEKMIRTAKEALGG